MESTEADINRTKEGCPSHTTHVFVFCFVFVVVLVLSTIIFWLLSGFSNFDIDHYFLYDCYCAIVNQAVS